MAAFEVGKQFMAMIGGLLKDLQKQLRRETDAKDAALESKIAMLETLVRTNATLANERSKQMEHTLSGHRRHLQALESKIGKRSNHED